MLEFDDIVVAPELENEFKDISHERYRSYHRMTEGEIVAVLINEPVALRVSESGGHYVIDSQGIVHYIPTGWFELVWANYPACGHVAF